MARSYDISKYQASNCHHHPHARRAATGALSAVASRLRAAIGAATLLGQEISSTPKFSKMAAVKYQNTYFNINGSDAFEIRGYL